jgi:hypothetical protein
MKRETIDSSPKKTQSRRQMTDLSLPLLQDFTRITPRFLPSNRGSLGGVFRFVLAWPIELRPMDGC